MRYETQKPKPLLNRIIASASKPGDIVLDPFAGCGTSIVEAHRLKRKWIGIDVTYLAINTIIKYMTDEFGAIQIPVEGRPTTVDEAHQLADTDPDGFEQWAVSVIGATPTGGKPVDGEIGFVDDDTMTRKRCIVEVTGGKASKKHFDAFLNHARDATIGVYVDFKPTAGMIGSAKGLGTYLSKGWGQRYPKAQIITVAEMLDGKRPNLPPAYAKRGRSTKLL